MTGITSYGAYIPRRRLQRKAIAAANSWFAPGLRGAGERAMANWDEDPVTMAVEAARDCLPANDPIKDRDFVDAITFASTTMPFSDRQNAGILAAALSLADGISSMDVSSSQRAGVSALIAANDAVKSGRVKAPLVAAGEKRKARAASSQEMQFGDAGAAFTLGNTNIIASILGSHSLTLDFVDHFRGEGEDYDYGWEERWIRDEGYSKIVPAAVKGLLEKTGVAAADIAHFIMPCTFAKLDQQIAKLCGIAPESVRDNLAATVGDCGAAHALLMLAHVLESAKPGEKILIAQFGQGCDAVLLEATPELAKLAKRNGVSGSLARRKEETNYMKYLAFNGLIEMERGMRAEKDNKTPLTVLYRKNDMLMGLAGGKCRVCGTAQFPRSRICVNPNCKAVDSQDPYSFAEQPGTILSWSADFLTYAMDPPNHYGMITFAEGGRFMADITDVEQGQIDSGSKVRMAFRVKDFDERRGFRRYFWKAVPV
ncbi:MAG TPA: 3-oxoacyl-[acyl-carrier-protein] synthase III C-terminal domain-containing protein [Rhizomicrobium sp.]|jgi:3-hydroxy-3-methylglutaryl CoA synthase|nr:3-oxoacyl-[acyl-carrier-protein] synthase III C-terminal domain-containing protein [Rhizomicrobium sp.]